MPKRSSQVQFMNADCPIHHTHRETLLELSPISQGLLTINNILMIRSMLKLPCA
ncbi:hypothetical protein TanjilG_18979 [Lupinus angustifolius]|uniref:Uncharacterized protein n=1 Tax=Lupinus angustifolius TaxID=3871 RepID=A0A4P1RRK7_LUPAN|nr:hypothetical protein TanjilG_18979 [Lupinus angustifolius]